MAESEFVLILIVMDNGLSRDRYAGTVNVLTVLILIVMDNGLSHYDDDEIYCSRGVVLILIVMDNGLSPLRWWNTHRRAGLNPYCNG